MPRCFVHLYFMLPASWWVSPSYTLTCCPPKQHIEHFCHPERLPGALFPANLPKPSFPTCFTVAFFCWTHMLETPGAGVGHVFLLTMEWMVWGRAVAAGGTGLGFTGILVHRASLLWPPRLRTPAAGSPCHQTRKLLMSLSLGAWHIPFWNPLNLGSSVSFILQFH